MPQNAEVVLATPSSPEQERGTRQVAAPSTRDDGRSRPRWRRALTTLQTALLFALLAGLTEGGWLLIWSHWFGRFTWVPRDHIWMAPASYALLFLALAIPLAVTETLLPRVPRLTATYIFSFAAFFSLTLPFEQLSHYATVLLCIGLASVVGRAVIRFPLAYERLRRSGSLALLGLVLLLAATLPLGRRLAERRALAGLPSPAEGVRNVILLILDTVRASSLELYGFRAHNTPGLLSEAPNGVVFSYAFSTAPWTLASHASLFTGKWAHDLDLDLRHPFHQPFLTVAGSLKADGFATAGFIANHDYTSHDSGLARGFIHYADYLASPRQLLASSALGQTEFVRGLVHAKNMGELAKAFAQHDLSIPPTRWSQPKRAEHVNREFLAWLAHRHDHPFFAFLNYYDAHFPYYCPAPYRARFSCKAAPENAYAGAIAYMDEQIRQLLGELRRRGLMRNTVVIITSDHGEQFGEHGLEGHGNSLYSAALHVPLVVLTPENDGARVEAPVSLRDLPATVRDLARVKRRSEFPGGSLMRFVRSRGGSVVPQDGEAVLSSYGMNDFHPAAWSSVTPGFHRIVNGPGSEELYDYVGDPAEMRNLTPAPQSQVRPAPRAGASGASLVNAAASAPR